MGWLQQFTPRTVLLHIGTNDTIIPLPALDATVRAFNAAIPGIVQQKVNAGRRVHLVDMFDALTAADLADGVHPNAGGYAKMATVWFNALQSVPESLTNPTTPPPPAGACTATYRTVNTWSTGLQAEVTVRNNRSSTLNGWTVSMALANGQSVVNLWNGINSGTSGPVSVRNASRNGTVAGSGSTMFGYVADGNGAAMPTNIGCASP